MKKRKKSNLQLSKRSIAKMIISYGEQIKGGTDPISIPMTQNRDDQSICYAIK